MESAVLHRHVCILSHPGDHLPLHPRTRAAIERAGFALADWPNIKVVPPQGYLDMLMLEQNARMILTDSGGIQKEAYWLKVPCVTLRNETEWVETVQVGWNQLVGANTEKIIQAVQIAYPDTKN